VTRALWTPIAPFSKEVDATELWLFEIEQTFLSGRPDPAYWTLPLGVNQFRGQYAADAARILAYVVVAMVPVLALYAMAERQLISGLTSGATKG
jgi:ABC-type glycerol-3-phosphate transport system permease component